MAKKANRQKAAPQNRHQRPGVAVQQQGQGLGSILKFAKIIIKNLLVKKIGRAVLNKLFNLYSKGTNKINKKMNRVEQSDIANFLVEMGAKYDWQMEGGISNKTIVYFFSESAIDNVKKYFRSRLFRL